MTETVNDKALRLVDTGEVVIRHYDTPFIFANVVGDHDTYPVFVVVGETALCGCRAGWNRVTCSHILAVMAEVLYVATGVPATVSLADEGYASIHPDLGDGR